MERRRMAHPPTPWPASPSCPQGGAPRFPTEVATHGDGNSVHTCPRFAPAGASTGARVLDTG